MNLETSSKTSYEIKIKQNNEIILVHKMNLDKVVFTVDIVDSAG